MVLHFEWQFFSYWADIFHFNIDIVQVSQSFSDTKESVSFRRIFIKYKEIFIWSLR